MSKILAIGKVWKAIIRANNYYADLYLEIEGEGGGRVKYFILPTKEATGRRRRYSYGCRRSSRNERAA